MAKRPAGVYLVSLWLFVIFSFWMRPLHEQTIWAALVTLMICLIWGLIQLRPWFIKATIGTLSLSILSILARLPQLLSHSQGRVPYFVLAFALGDGLGIWYLTRPSFAEQCAKYREAKR